MERESPTLSSISDERDSPFRTLEDMLREKTDEREYPFQPLDILREKIPAALLLQRIEHEINQIDKLLDKLVFIEDIRAVRIQIDSILEILKNY
jgi:ribosomal protein L16 Arg81 hydroxylase